MLPGSWTNDATDIDGANVTTAQAETNSTWWTTTADWNTVWGTSEAAPWQWDGDNNRPKLYWEQ
jgi:hypothetical protein